MIKEIPMLFNGDIACRKTQTRRPLKKKDARWKERVTIEYLIEQRIQISPRKFEAMQNAERKLEHLYEGLKAYFEKKDIYESWNSVLIHESINDERTEFEQSELNLKKLAGLI